MSILVAARNEEATIARCRRALTALNYPAGQLELLIGDDASTGDTAAVVRRDKPHFRLLPIRQRLGTAPGKSNVLAHLCRTATGDYFLLTDADLALVRDWVPTSPAAAGLGVVTGITTAGGLLFGRWQGFDWLFGLNSIRLLTDLGLPVTAVGNNRLVRRAAYESIGGYEALVFTIIEDLQFFTEVVAQGWGYRNLIDPRTLGVSVAQPTVRHLPHQRKRWMKRAGPGSWQLGALFSSYSVFYTVLGQQNLVPDYVSGHYAAAGRAPRAPGRAVLYEWYLLAMSVAVLVYTA